MRKRLDTKEGCLVMKYIQTARMHRKVLEQGLSSTGVYRSQHHLLMFVADHPQVSQKELARLHGVSTATIAVSLKKLEQGGYIERKVDVKDNRYNQICITAKGMAAVERSAAIFEDLEKRMFQGFSAEDFEKLVLAYDGSVRKDSPYRVREQDVEMVDNGRYRYPKLVFERRGKG